MPRRQARGPRALGVPLGLIAAFAIGLIYSTMDVLDIFSISRAFLSLQWSYWVPGRDISPFIPSSLAGASQDAPHSLLLMVRLKLGCTCPMAAAGARQGQPGLGPADLLTELGQGQPDPIPFPVY